MSTYTAQAAQLCPLDNLTLLHQYDMVCSLFTFQLRALLREECESTRGRSLRS